MMNVEWHVLFPGWVPGAICSILALIAIIVAINGHCKLWSCGSQEDSLIPTTVGLN